MKAFLQRSVRAWITLLVILAVCDRAEAQAVPVDADPADPVPADPVPADPVPEVSEPPSPPEPSEPPGQAEAMERFADAQSMFDRGDHRGALAEMQRVYELLEGAETQYIVLYNIARVYEELHRYDLAVDTYQRFLDTAPADAEDRSGAEASLRALERLLGIVAITVNVEHAEVWVGEWQVGEAPGEIRIPSGVNVLEVRTPGYEPARQQIDVTARSRVEIDITLAQLSDFDGLDPAIFVTTTVVAGLAGIVGGALGGTALTMSNDAAACGERAGCSFAEGTPARRQQIADLALAADVMYATAGLFAVASVVLAVLTDWDGAPAPETAAPTALRLTPMLGGSGSSVGGTLGVEATGAF